MTDIHSSQRLRLYLIRHGEVEDAKDGKVFGQRDVALSDRGRDQSRRLADKLASEPLIAVYSSDLQRASQAAKLIAAPHGLKFQQSAAWREIDMGQWEGLTLSDLQKQDAESVKRLFEEPESFQYAHGESFLAFETRIRKAFNELRSMHEDGEIVLVTHGGVARAIIGTALEMPMRTWLRLAQGYGCLNVLDWYGENPVVQFLNFTESTWT